MQEAAGTFFQDLEDETTGWSSSSNEDDDDNDNQHFGINNRQKTIKLYDAAMQVLKLLVRLSSAHNTNLIGGTKGFLPAYETSQSKFNNQNSKQSDAWVWGSNASHQLAEGRMKYILINLERTSEKLIFDDRSQREISASKANPRLQRCSRA